MASDPLGWNGGGGGGLVLAQLAQRVVDAVEGTGPLFIDALERLLDSSSAVEVARWLQGLRVKHGLWPIVAGVHVDGLDEAELRAVEHVASTLVKVHQPPVLPRTARVFCTVHMVHKRASGKMSVGFEECEWSESGSGLLRSYVVGEEGKGKRTGKAKGKKEEDELAGEGLTFNVKLTDKQRETKEALVLPYVEQGRPDARARVQEHRGGLLSLINAVTTQHAVAGPGGEDFDSDDDEAYEVDSDDSDESDPDADLAI